MEIDYEEGWERRWVQENAKRLWHLRRERGISLRQAADGAGLNVSQATRVEAGQDCRITTLLKMAYGLGYQVELIYQEMSEDGGDLQYDESERRRLRRDAGLLLGKSSGDRW